MPEHGIKPVPMMTILAILIYPRYEPVVYVCLFLPQTTVTLAWALKPIISPLAVSSKLSSRAVADGTDVKNP